MTYRLIKQFDNEHAHIQFEGSFKGSDVVWNTHFFTLKKYAAENKLNKNSLKGVISIEPGESNTLNLTVALNITAINEPNINKMMIMINQYKNLSLGLHQYG